MKKCLGVDYHSVLFFFYNSSATTAGLFISRVHTSVWRFYGIAAVFISSSCLRHLHRFYTTEKCRRDLFCFPALLEWSFPGWILFFPPVLWTKKSLLVITFAAHNHTSCEIKDHLCLKLQCEHTRFTSYECCANTC